MSVPSLLGPELPWQSLPFHRTKTDDRLFPLGLTLGPSYSPWVDKNSVDSLPDGRAMAIIVLSPTRTMISGLRVKGSDSSSSRIHPIPGPPAYGNDASEAGHRVENQHVWAVPLDVLERDDLHLQVQCHPEVPELFLVADVIDERELKVLEEMQKVFAKANRLMLILVTYLLNLRIQDANADRQAPERYRDMRHSFLAFDYVTNPQIQLARSHFDSLEDLVDLLEKHLRDAHWSGHLEPQVTRILQFFFAEENDSFKDYVNPMTSLLYDRVSTLTAHDHETVSSFAGLEWGLITHPPHLRPQTVAIRVYDYIGRAFDLFRQKPLSPKELGMAHPDDLVTFGWGKLALGFQYDMGESVLNCVPNSIYFLMICDLSILMAEHFEGTKDQGDFFKACQRFRLSLAAEEVYLTVYKPRETRDGKVSITSYSYMDGPFSNRITELEVKELIQFARDVPGDVTALRAHHRRACQTATNPVARSHPAEA